MELNKVYCCEIRTESVKGKEKNEGGGGYQVYEVELWE